MLRLTQKFTFSLLGIMVLPLLILAQEKRASDSTRYKFLPTGVRLGTDALSLIRTKTSDQFSGWEINADIDFTRYYLAFDYGQWGSQFQLKNGYHDNRGKYYRVGLDVNFLLKDPDRNMFFLGARFAQSHFTDSASYTLGDTHFGDILIQTTNQGVDASWKEITGGLRVKIWKWVWMGYTARYKFGLRTKGEGNLKPYDVPGYGLTIKSNTWGFNYQIFLRIPVRKQK